MTSIETWERYRTLTDKDANGNIGIPEFVRLFNMEQQLLMLDCIGDQRQYKQNFGAATRSTELSERMMDMVAPFLTDPVYVQLSSGRGRYNQGDYAGSLKVWVSAYTNPSCGEEITVPQYEKAVESLTASEWKTRSDEQRYDGASLSFPIFQRVNGTHIEVRPRTVRAVWVNYVRLPRPITLALLPNSEEYDPNAANQDPEWNDMDVDVIIERLLTPSGIREQSPAWINAGERSKQG